MQKQEFEAMALRAGEHINAGLYAEIEYFYTSANEYHEAHGGAEETKTDFIKRVYGGKINTAKTITEKTAREAQKENRYALQGCNISAERLEAMDEAIMEHYKALSTFKY